MATIQVPLHRYFTKTIKEFPVIPVTFCSLRGRPRNCVQSQMDLLIIFEAISKSRTAVTSRTGWPIGKTFSPNAILLGCYKLQGHPGEGVLTHVIECGRFLRKTKRERLLSELSILLRRTYITRARRIEHVIRCVLVIDWWIKYLELIIRSRFCEFALETSAFSLWFRSKPIKITYELVGWITKTFIAYTKSLTTRKHAAKRRCMFRFRGEPSLVCSDTVSMYVRTQRAKPFAKCDSILPLFCWPVVFYSDYTKVYLISFFYNLCVCTIYSCGLHFGNKMSIPDWEGPSARYHSIEHLPFFQANLICEVLQCEGTG